ncbi:peptidase inhibitor family I36 protein [Streptomyces sp. NPDC086549]|uniref:peptidase inhibitor family I36 protein n=1 Tax=Streptomyces sp. NPDC086549 TaxID=3365752 RepID=UPI00381CC385
MKLRSRLTAAAAAVAFTAAGAVAGTTGPAAADSATPQAQVCVAGYYCVWTLDSYEGDRYKFQYSNPDWRQTSQAGAYHNDQSSWNSGTSGLGVYLIGDGGRILGCLPQGHGWWHHNPANRGEGNRWTGNC